MELDPGPRHEAPAPSPGAPAPRSHLRRVAIPDIRDVSGFQLDDRCLRMSGVSLADLRAAVAGHKPIGFPSRRVWREFQDDLAGAFAEAGLTDVSARLGGSSRSFFSSPWARRPFPQDLGQLRAQITAAKHHAGWSVEDLEREFAEAAERYRAAGFLQPGPKPTKHFWDSRYLLKIDAAPCDYDIEVASDAIDARMRRAAAEWRAANLGQPETFHVDGSCQWEQEAVLAQFPALARFKERWTERLGRTVDFECFDGNERLRFAQRQDWWVLRGLD